ncbi:MAG: oligosaccharide flippase family protein [Pseudomonadota bacterium]
MNDNPNTAPSLASFSRALLAYGASEAVAKVTRFGVVVAVARSMEIEHIGLAAAAMASGEILKALTETGAGQRIIIASDQDLEATCQRANRLMWFWCAGLAFAQLTIAAIWLGTGGDMLVGAMIAVLALEYLFMPGGIVQAALAMREGRMSGTASVAGAQVVGQNLLTVVLVLATAHPLAIVLPKVLSGPIWLVGMRRLRPWRADGRVSPGPVRPFLSYGVPVVGIEVVKAMRLHADKLIIGALLGPEALGLYFFAFNAGLGLATSVSQAFSLVLLPHLSRASDRIMALGSAMRVALVCLVPLVLLQAALAPVYVPLVFGTRWAEAAPLVAILCLIAVPQIVWSGAAQALRAEARTGREFAVTGGLASALIAGTALASPYGLATIAWTQVAISAAVQFTAAWPAIAAAIPRNRQNREA